MSDDIASVILIALGTCLVGCLAGFTIANVSLEKDCTKIGVHRIDDRIYDCSPRNKP